jgi:DNA segregation ATPase FtsK/SpoIIIE, S-DNA-T family
MAETEPEKKANRMRNEIKGGLPKNEPVLEKPSRSRKKAEVVEEPEAESAPKRNKPRAAPAAKTENNEPEKPSGSSGPSFLNRIRTDEKLHKITGAFLTLIVAPYLVVSFVSYFFTWQTDQDKVMSAAGTLLAAETEVSNMLGKFGALVSHVFIHNWFGVTSFWFPLLALTAGLRLLTGQAILPLGKIFRYGLFFTVFGSILLGYAFRNNWFFPGGVFGFEISSWLNGIVGIVGTGLLLFFTAMTFLVVVFNFSFSFLTKKPAEATSVVPEAITEEPIRNTIVDLPEQEEELTDELTSDTEIEEELDEEEVESEEDDAETEEIQEELPAPEVTEELNTEEVVVAPIAQSDLSTDDGVQFTVEKKEEVTLADDDINRKASELVAEFGEYDPTLDLSGYQFPPIDLLEAYSSSGEIGVNAEELNLNKNRIVETLGNYGIAIDKIKATIGPTVTLYEIIPAAGVRISTILH